MTRDKHLRLLRTLGASVLTMAFGACGGDSGGSQKDTTTPPTDTSADVSDVSDTSKDTADTSLPEDTADDSVGPEDTADTSGPGDTGDTSDPGDTAEPGDTTDTSAPSDTSEPLDTADTSGPSDTNSDTEVTTPCSGATLEAGCECSGDGECDSGFCAVGIEGSYCVATCDNDDDCGTGKCVTGPGGGDGVCLAATDFLCVPCTADSECRQAGGTGRCIGFGPAGSFCGTTCSNDQDCPESFGCQQGQCVPDSGMCECTDVALELGASTTCTVTNGFGTCSGQRFCGPGGLTSCNARTPAQDICNGLDDDCSGLPDDAANICNDGNVCTLDSCGGQQGCVYQPQAGSCDDGNACTGGDTCINGLCEGVEDICPCQTAAECEGQIPEGMAKDCLTITCSAQNTCNFAPKAGSCNDGDVCTTGDQCSEGACVGTDKDCDDDNECTTDVCGADGLCDNEPRTGSCVDGDPCTVNDQCNGGTCTGTALDCSNLDDACHVGICDGAGGCVAQSISCGVSGVRVHVPATSFSKKGTGATWLKGSAGHSGPVGRSSNGIHTIHFGFHPGVYR